MYSFFLNNHFSNILIFKIKKEDESRKRAELNRIISENNRKIEMQQLKIVILNLNIKKFF